ncbi:MAG: DNA replication/repair protein RecF [Thermoleophilaceae bacterium]|nr:DNA replication/repair protein RecF [Thermoleophilaceae bacterium]
MRVTRLELRDFRNYKGAGVELGRGLTVVVGANGAGKTNLLEALYLGCTGKSPRTPNQRELVRRGASVARVVLYTVDGEDAHRIEVGFEPGGSRRIRVDGARVDGLIGFEERPLVGVFMPERLELMKGPPAVRRAHLDQVVAALWPARADARTAYSRALAQRNALLVRIRAGRAGTGALHAWDAELARQGMKLMDHRRGAVEALRPAFAELAGRLGLAGRAELLYRPRSDAIDASGFAAELRERRQADVERGFTAHGPHRDELSLTLDGNSLRIYGSQGQQRVALLALLFAERRLLAERRGRPPLMLLDDVMSELDADRRELLAELLAEGGQALVTATEPDQLPEAALARARLIRVEEGRIVQPMQVVAA